ncbi:MAG: DUF4112 domain-containing protein [Verrucomicrobiota bacterium]
MEAKIRRIRALAVLLDSQFRLPGTQMRFGWDGIIGLLPFGDLLTAVPGLYLLFEARRAGVRKRALAKMLWNLTVDTLVGLIPILGDIFDFAFKANLKNANILIEELERQQTRVRSAAG